MAKRIINSVNVTKIDILNAEASSPFKDLIGKTAEVSGAAIVEDTKSDGTTGEYAYVFTKDGYVYGGNSASVHRIVDGLIEIMTEEPNANFTVTVESRPTSSGREFLTMRIIPADNGKSKK